MNRSATAVHHRINKPQWSHAVILTVIRLDQVLADRLEQRTQNQKQCRTRRLGFSGRWHRRGLSGIDSHASRLAKLSFLFRWNACRDRSFGNFDALEWNYHNQMMSHPETEQQRSCIGRFQREAGRLWHFKHSARRHARSELA